MVCVFHVLISGFRLFILLLLLVLGPAWSKAFLSKISWSFTMSRCGYMCAVVILSVELDSVKKMDKWAYKGNNTVLGVTVKYKHDVDML